MPAEITRATMRDFAAGLLRRANYHAHRNEELLEDAFLDAYDAVSAAADYVERSDQSQG